MSDIGSIIKQVRKENGLRQEDLSKMINKSKQVISNWERNYSYPNADDIIVLAIALQTTTDRLLGMDKLPRPGLKRSKQDLVHQKSFLKKLMDKISTLTPDGQEKVEKYTEMVAIFEEVQAMKMTHLLNKQELLRQ